MLRFALIFFLVFVSALPVYAQQSVRLRAGEHTDYARLVFDWNKTVIYRLQETAPGKLTVSFETDAALDQGGGIAGSYKNISEIKVVSESPLKVEIGIPPGSRVRDFFVGSRVVLDIYDPDPGAAPPPEPEPVAETEETPEPEPEVTAATAAPAEEITEPEASNTETNEPEASGTEDTAEVPGPKVIEQAGVVEPDEAVLDAPPAKDVPKSQVEKTEPVKEVYESRVGNNLVTFSSTKSSAMAVFLRDGKIWMVNDNTDMLLNPQLSGPQSSQLTPLEKVEMQQARTFTVSMIEGAHVRVQGGGLIWRILVTGTPKKRKPVQPVRKDVTEDSPRSGRMVWPFKEVEKILKVKDPVSGKHITVVTVGNAKQYAGPAQDFVDFEVLPSPLGLAILPAVDDLEISVTDEGVEVSRPGGLALTSDRSVNLIRSYEETRLQGGDEKQSQPERRIFDFRNWEMGGLSAIEENKTILLSSLADTTQGGKIEGLVTLAKMYLANGLWAEAAGFLDFAEREIPDLVHNPEFMALKGATQALGWKSAVAFENLSAEVLEPFQEIGYWRAYALADLGDWQQAQAVLPPGIETLSDYSPVLSNRLGLVLAEVALRGGELDKGLLILKMIEPFEENLNLQQAAAYQYLKGEAARQNGDIEETKKLWEPLLVGPDDMYRAKAGLALTRLRVDEGEIKPSDAIDNLERLRYAWRGDELEAQINYWLGKTYFEAGEYLKGLNIMREAASYATGTELGRRITSEMTDVFTDLFVGGGLEKVSPLDAAALYEQFSELIPPGSRGDRVVERLAEHMVRADLLSRAANLLQHQLDHRLTGLDAFRVGVRLAAIRLIDEKPVRAIEALNKAAAVLQKLPEEVQTEQRFLEISLLRARAFSQEGRPDQAIELLRELPLHPDVNRLKADIAWNAGYWDDAGEALGDVILDQNISLTRPLSPEHAALILQRAVALNLASDRVGLANMREKYSDAMAQTDKARIFEVITRPRQSAALADRETLRNIVAEVDLFADFLNSYKVSPEPTN